MNSNMLEVKDLKVHFRIGKGLLPKQGNYLKAVDGISFDIKYGETLGLVGESGCGKSTTGRAILGLLKESKGEVLFEGKQLLTMKKNGLKTVRKDMQLIFQDPYASLNPRLKIGDALEEVLIVHKMGNKERRKARVEELMEMVGLNKHHLSRYPHEFSGGQRQRIVIARALAVNPKFIVCDESVSALDVSVQSQIINLLERLQEELNLTYLFIGHDLSVVNHFSDKIAVMYLGKIVEMAESNELFENPRHPYTRALLSAVLLPDPELMQDLSVIEGEIPSPLYPPSGCRFHTRCKFATEKCAQEEPLTRKVDDHHFVACHFNLD